MDVNFWKSKRLIGVVHLPPLPGSPLGSQVEMSSVIEHALFDAAALEAGGADAVIIENFFDTPFPREQSPPHTVAAMTLAVQAVVSSTALPVGVNVLRNDVSSALAIAKVTGAVFVRVNVYVGAVVADQGLIQGAAREAILYRQQLSAVTKIWADIHVKHASQLGNTTLEDDARDAVLRGHADALIITGASTGSPPAAGDLRRVRHAVDAPLLVGSGLDVEHANELIPHAHGAIVGSSLKVGGVINAPIDPDRVRRLRVAMDAVSDVG